MKTLIFLLVAICALSFGQLSIATDHNRDSDAVTYRPDITFTLRTDIAEGKLVFVGETDAIAGKINPDLSVPEGAVVQINLINGDGAIHDIAIPEFGAGSGHITAKGAATAMVFRATRAGNFEYLCTLPGHKAAGKGEKHRYQCSTGSLCGWPTCWQSRAEALNVKSGIHRDRRPAFRRKHL
jgi:nitrite reductase (NO-forming)